MSKYYMPSSSDLRDPSFAHQSPVDRRERVPGLPAIWAGFLTLLIAAPWLRGGYIFGTDWTGPRRFDFPTGLYSSAPLEAVLAAVSRVVSAEWTGKLFVLFLLFTAALMAYRAAPAAGFVPRAAASTVYLFNPFVFGRLHYGQWFVLAGYALLPWVAIRLRRLLEQPSVARGLLLGVSLALVATVSSHLFLISTVLVGVLLLSYVVATDKRATYLKSIGPGTLAAVVAVLVISSYWLVPFVLGRGPEAAALGGITSADLHAFAAVADPRLGLVPNLLGLYGFWAENTGRFTSMKAFVPFWPGVLLVLLSIAAVGAVAAFRSRRERLAPWVAGLLIAAAVALVLEMGVSSPLTSGFVTWLDSTFPIYRGMRDAGKWAALLALVYSQLVALGAAAILAWLRHPRRLTPRTEWTVGVAIGLLLALPLYYGNGLLFGMHGEIQPSQYPAGWYAADRVLLSDSHPGRTIFFPWHEYMTYSFVRNQNAVIACPAPGFFSTPVLANTNPELPGEGPPTDADQLAIADLVAAGSQGEWAQVLAAHGVKYILVAREVDWKSYSYLGGEPDLMLVGDYGSILLYRNTRIREGFDSR
jgi:hypothetical protein